MVFLISGQGYFTFLYNTQSTQPRGWTKRRTNNHALGLTPSARREKSMTILCILWTNASVYSSETPTKLTHFLALFNPASSKIFLDRQLLLTSIDWSVLPTSLDCSVLLTVFFCFSLEPSSPSGFEGDLAQKPFLWVSRLNWQRHPLTYTANAQHRVTYVYDKYISKVSDFSRGWLEGFFLNSYYTEVWRGI